MYSVSNNVYYDITDGKEEKCLKVEADSISQAFTLYKQANLAYIKDIFSGSYMTNYKDFKAKYNATYICTFKSTDTIKTIKQKYPELFI